MRFTEKLWTDRGAARLGIGKCGLVNCRSRLEQGNPVREEIEAVIGLRTAARREDGDYSVKVMEKSK